MASYKAAKASMEVCRGLGLSVADKLLEAVQIARLPDLGGPGGEIVVLDAGSQFRGTAKKTPSFSRREASKPRRFQIGGGAIGCLDDCDQVRGQCHRQPEAYVDCSQQSNVDCLVGDTDHGLE